VFPVFRLFLDDKIIVWPWAMILSSRNNLNMGNTDGTIGAIKL